MFGALRLPGLPPPPKYVRVEEEDYSDEAYEVEKTEERFSRPQEIRRPGTSIRAHLVTAFSIFSFIVFSLSLALLLAYHGRNVPAAQMDKAVLDCGSTIEEAQAKGCKFDVLDYSWTPAECYDEETSIEFRQWLNQSDIQFGVFPFFKDMKAKHRVDGESELARRIGGKDGVLTYSTQQEHRAHCVFTMRRFARMQKNPQKRWVAITLKHLEHCLAEVVEGLKGPMAWEKGRLGSEFGVGFRTC